MPRKSIVGELKDQAEEAAGATNSPVRRSSRISLRRASTEESIQPSQVSTPKAAVKTRRASLTQEASEPPQEQARPATRGRRGSTSSSTSSRNEEPEIPKIEEKPTAATPEVRRPMTRRRSASMEVDVIAPAEELPTRSAAKRRRSVSKSEEPSEPAATGGTPVKKPPANIKVSVFDSIEEAENESQPADVAPTNVQKKKKTDVDLNLSVINESFSEEQTSFKETSPQKTISGVRVSPRKSTPHKDQEVKGVEAAAASPRKALFVEDEKSSTIKESPQVSSVKESPQIASPKRTSPRVTPTKAVSVSDSQIASPRKALFVIEESEKEGEIESSPKISDDSQVTTSSDSQDKTSLDSQEKIDPHEKTPVDSQQKTPSVDPQEKTSASPQRSSLRISLKKSLENSESPQKNEASPPNAAASAAGSPAKKTKEVKTPEDALAEAISESLDAGLKEVGPKRVISEDVSWSPQVIPDENAESLKAASPERGSKEPISEKSSPKKLMLQRARPQDVLESPQKTSVSPQKTSVSPHKASASPQKSTAVSSEASPKTTSGILNGTSSPVVCLSPRKELSKTDSPPTGEVACDSTTVTSDTLESSQMSDSMHFSLGDTSTSSIISNKENITPEVTPSKAKTTENVFAEKLDASTNQGPYEPMEVDESILEMSTVQPNTSAIVGQLAGSKMSNIVENLKAAEEINNQVSEMIEYGLKNEKLVSSEVVKDVKSSNESLDSVMKSLSKVIKKSEGTPEKESKKNDSFPSPSTTNSSPQSDALYMHTSPSLSCDSDSSRDRKKIKFGAKTSMGMSPLAKHDFTPRKRVGEKAIEKPVEVDEAVVDISDESSGVEEVADCAKGDSSKEAASPTKTIDFSSDHMDMTGNTEEVEEAEGEAAGKTSSGVGQSKANSVGNSEPIQGGDESSDEEAIDANGKVTTEVDQASSDDKVASSDEKEAASEEQASSDEEKASGDEDKASSDEDEAPGDEEKASSDEQDERIAEKKNVSQTEITSQIDLHRTEGDGVAVTESEASSEEEEEDANTVEDFLDNMAVEASDLESEESHDSNEIIGASEDVGFDDSDSYSVGTYDSNDSFIDDDRDNEELLSGDEYDLGQAKKSKKPKKSRIIHSPEVDNDTGIIKTNKTSIKPTPVTPKSTPVTPKSTPVTSKSTLSSSSDSTTVPMPDFFQLKRVETSASTAVREAFSVEDFTGSKPDPQKSKKKNRRKKKKAPAHTPATSSTEEDKESLKRKRKDSAGKTAVTKKVKREEQDSTTTASETAKKAEESKTKRAVIRKKKSKKSKKKVGQKVEEPQTLNIVNEALRRQKMNMKVEARSTVDWDVTSIKLKPFKSDLEDPAVKVQRASPVEAERKFHPKDFRNQMQFDPKRVKRVETAKMLKKRGG